MDCQSVKRLLDKHFGARHSSLSLGGASNAEKRFYYYALPNETEILAIRDLLRAGGSMQLPELRQAFPEELKKTDCDWLCVCYTERGSEWTIRFVPIRGVRYHTARNNTVAASLLLAKYPTITLESADSENCFGLWQPAHDFLGKPLRAGVTYWVNKHLLYNRTFRPFVIDLLLAIAAEKKYYILKDVARSIKRFGYFLPEVAYPELVKHHKPSELMRLFASDSLVLNKDFNKLDLNVGYLVQKLAPYIDRRDYKLLFALDRDAIPDSFALQTVYGGFSVPNFVKSYYGSRLPHTELVRECAEDYAQMCIDANTKIRLNCTDQDLFRIHDDAVIASMRHVDRAEFLLPLLKFPSRFDRLESALAAYNPKEFRRIGTTQQLYEEGVRQHNCVYSRRDLVRRDIASIIHWDHNGSSYTVQFAIGAGGKYLISEVRARFNRSITNDDLRDLIDAVNYAQALEAQPNPA